jgi:hypothetical protein
MDNKKLHYLVKFTFDNGDGLDVEIYSKIFLGPEKKLLLKMRYYSGIGYVFDMLDKMLAPYTDSYIYDADGSDKYNNTRIIKW